MEEDNLIKLRRELREKSSAAQIQMLKGLRDELASRRWEIILEIDAVREMVSHVMSDIGDQGHKEILEEVNQKLRQVEQLIARIPDDFIPAF
jgi:hypothetical protein